MTTEPPASADPSPAPKLNRPLIAVVLFAAIGAALLIVLLGPKPTPEGPPEGLAGSGFVGEAVVVADPRDSDPAFATLRVPSFDLIDENGSPIDESALDGEYSVVAFIFTNCPFACPMIASALQQIEAQIQRSDAPFFLFSVDPERDTPERLREYKAQRDLSARWNLVTGPFEVTRNIVENGLRLTLAPDEGNLIDLPEGGTMTNVLHPSRLALIGPDRRVLAFYDSSSFRDYAGLANRLDDIARLQAEDPR